jgi:hypothetical protein
MKALFATLLAAFALSANAAAPSFAQPGLGLDAQMAPQADEDKDKDKDKQDKKDG